MSNEALSVANDSILLADVEWGDEARVIAIGEQMGSSQPAAAAVPDWLWNFLHTYIYIIVFAGIAGNVLCIYFFLRNSELSRMSVTQYLMALAVSDVLFLVSLGFTLLQLHNVQWAGVWGLCEVMMVSCRFVSISPALGMAMITQEQSACYEYETKG
uniref:G-protein coupled receptors family 1 profile domain-containing protein n=1 Tax=Plectus sambesii TaxID=2011161 RepID=A0A914XSU1_9BILA